MKNIKLLFTRRFNRPNTYYVQSVIESHCDNFAYLLRIDIGIVSIWENSKYINQNSSFGPAKTYIDGRTEYWLYDRKVSRLEFMMYYSK